MVLRSIHIGEKEQELLDSINDEIKHFETRIEELAIQFKKVVVANERFKDKLHDDTCKLLHSIFRPTFVQEIIFNLKTIPDKVISVSDLQPYVCNYPPELTLRTKNFHGNGIAPCKRRLAKNSVFFCSLPQHLAYAKKLGLPVNELDILELDLEVPPKIRDVKVKHVRKKHTKKNNAKQPMDTDDELTEENYVHMRTIVKEVETESDSPLKKRKIDVRGAETSVGEVPRFQCSHSSLINNTQCQNDGIYVDPYKGLFLFCEKHSVLDDTLLDDLENANIDPEIISDLRQIQNIDDDIDYNLSDDSPDHYEIQKLCIDRYFLSSKYGFGMPHRLVKYLPDVGESSLFI